MSRATSPLDRDRSAQARRVVRALRRHATETDLYLASAGRGEALNRTDMNGLALVMDGVLAGEVVTPGRLSSAMLLSPAATTTMLERLEAQGHIRRELHPTDKRSVSVVVTDEALQMGARVFRALGEKHAPILAEHTEDQLSMVADFLERIADATAAARGSHGSAAPPDSEP